MINFFLSFIIYVAVTFLLALSVRYGVYGVIALDSRILARRGSSYEGFDWYFRIPTSAGIIPEYLYSVILGRENYFKTNWWALKCSSFISVLLFIAILKSRRGAENYFSLEMIKDQGFSALLTSGTFVWYLNIISFLFLLVFVLITVESIKVAGVYAPIRIIGYVLLSCLMSSLTVAILAAVLVFALIYIVWKIIGLLFFSNGNQGGSSEDEESAGDILRHGLTAFKNDLYQWMAERKQKKRIKKKTTKEENRKKEKPGNKIRRKKSHSIYDNTDIPRLHPDKEDK